MSEPVAWRWRRKLTTSKGWSLWVYEDLEPVTLPTKDENQIQPLYTHPEDAPATCGNWVSANRVGKWPKCKLKSGHIGKCSATEDAPERRDVKAPRGWVMCPNCKGTGRDSMAYSFAGICYQCVGTGRVAAFLQGAWPDLPDILTDAATQLRRLRKIYEDAPESRDSVPPGGPKIVCLCGSTQFYDAFQRANYEETMRGHIVLSVGFYPHSQMRGHGEEVGCTKEQKRALDGLHLWKIDLADEILVLNVGGYVGESTAREIVYAEEHGKPVRFLEAVNRLKGDEI